MYKLTPHYVEKRRVVGVLSPQNSGFIRAARTGKPAYQKNQSESSESSESAESSRARFLAITFIFLALECLFLELVSASMTLNQYLRSLGLSFSRCFAGSNFGGFPYLQPLSEGRPRPPDAILAVEDRRCNRRKLRGVLRCGDATSHTGKAANTCDSDHGY